MTYSDPGPHEPDSERATPSPAAVSGPDGESESLWIRALYMVLFAVIGYGLLLLFLALCGLQLLVLLVTAKQNVELRKFTRELLAYIGVTLAYLAFLQDEKPFPFSPFPHATKTDSL